MCLQRLYLLDYELLSESTEPITAAAVYRFVGKGGTSERFRIQSTSLYMYMTRSQKMVSSFENL